MIAAAIALAPRSGRAANPAAIYVLAIGNNAAPLGDGDAAPLRYADDDATAFYRFTKGIARRGVLLTLMDSETQARFPGEVAEARPPTLNELRAAVSDLRSEVRRDRERGVEPTVLIFFSGHGTRPAGRPAGLALLDGALTHEMLFEEVLGQLPARFVHLFVDACYAEAVVQPRDTDAEHVELSDADLAAYASRSTLARFPHVGTVIAATSSSQTHEWEVYRQGVFTHELLSGLRGGADVNGDRRIEYSEIYAFLAAANREVPDQRARLHVMARPPADDARAAIVDLRDVRDGAIVAGVPASAGATYFEDELGDRLADIHVENGGQATLVLPAGRRLFVHCRLGEGSLAALRPNQTVRFDSIAFGPPTRTARGSLDLALRKGLFAVPFGAGYYRGFIDQTSSFLLVSFPEPDAEPARSHGESAQVQLATPGPASEPRPSRGRRDLFAAAGAGRGVATDLGPALELRVGLRPPRGTGLAITLDAAAGRTSQYDEWHAIVTGGYRVGAGRGRWGASAGLSAGGGVIAQNVNGSASLLSAALAVAPGLAAWCNLLPRLDLAFEADAAVLAYRRDWTTVLSFLPAAYVGVLVHL
jgi:hypothetical protein